MKTAKPFLCEKVIKYSKINLVKGDKIISCDNQIAKKFSAYLISIPILNMPSNGYKCPASSEQDLIFKILDKYKDHRSIKLIKAKNTKYTSDDINDSIHSLKFPNELKQADIVPTHKKKSKLSKENYRPISILPNVSKIYESCLYNQIATIYFELVFTRAIVLKNIS